MILGENGYIGSYIKDKLPKTDALILLAGHSSVKMCDNDPGGAWTNNVDLFRNLLNNHNGKFIYASSASVYDGVENPNEDCNQFNLKGMYDLTKRTIDNLAQLSDKEYYGLRFATVNGWSPNLRVDVMLNKMVYDAKTAYKITVQNPQLVRPILGLNDLCRAITAILKGGRHAGIYNLASFNASVLEMAEFVGKRYNADVEVIETDAKPYAFGIDTTKFEKTYNFKFEDTLESVVESLDRPFLNTGVRV
jgi:nucleoside-diphosphate-sugar epimerase